MLMENSFVVFPPFAAENTCAVQMKAVQAAIA